MTHHRLQTACAAAAVFALLQPTHAMTQQAAHKAVKRAQHVEKDDVVIAPRSSEEVSRHILPLARAPRLTQQQKLELLRRKVKYVFVLFQENRSFDFYFGTYPGARGLFSQPASQTPGFVQPIVEMDGSVGTISPFNIPQSVTATSDQSTVALYPEDIDSVNHGHSAIDAKLDLDAKHIPRNDRYAFIEQGLTGKLNAEGTVYTGPAPTLAQKQKGELVMSHVDCDTAPFLWNYADRFTLFDNFFDTVIGPSTPNAIAMIAGQSGETQWVEHPELASNVNPTAKQEPVTADPQPYWGSALDVLTPPADKQPIDNPTGASANNNPASNQTYATLPLSFMGNRIEATTKQDLNPSFDLTDVREDIKKIAGDGNKPINWGWFQEGYDAEPNDSSTVPHGDYIAHHNAPQYFGYVADNPEQTKAHLKGLGDFYAAIKAHELPASGVFYIRGGYGNIDGLTPRSPSPAAKAAFKGNDDHPGYSDTQISEALLADSVNAIANSKYWPESVIIITYDESDGLYDHTQPVIRSFDPRGLALDQGPRIPTIVISPYAKVHAISHETTEHGSIIKLIDELFHLTPLADLPDEARARAEGLKKYGQAYLGPSDDLTPGVGDMLSAFDNARLTGKAPALEPRYATIPADEITRLPQEAGSGCRALQITPTDMVNGKLIDPAPADFNPRPSTNPGLPTSGSWPTN